MDLAVVLEHRFDRTPDGAVWTQTMFPQSFWRRYLEVFDRVRIVARARPVDAVPGDFLRVDGEGVELFGIPYYHGPWEYLRRIFQVRRAVRDAVGPRHAVILRVSSQVANCLDRRLKRDQRPYGVEVVCDPWDVFAPGSVRHPLRALFRRYFAGRLQRQCRNASAASYVTEHALQRRYPPSPAAFSTFYSSVELPAEAVRKAPPADFDKGDPPHLIAVGTLSQTHKGFDILIDAVARCVRGGLQLRLTIVGGGTHRDDLEAQAQRAGCGNHVRFLGSIASGEAVRRQLDEADLFVLPSRSEGVPRAMIEAMARALPCIGTHVGGIPELIPEEDRVRAGDADALAAKIREVLSDPDRMKQASQRNLEIAARYRDDRLHERRLAFYGAVRTATERWLLNNQRLHQQERSVENNAGTEASLPARGAPCS